MKIKIKIKEAGIRLDKFLVKKLKELSRSNIQKSIKNSLIKVNDKVTSAHYKLKENDLIEIIKKETKAVKNALKDKKLPTIKIIKDAPEYLIVNKPAGLTMHGADHITEITLVDLILKKYPKIKKIGEDPFRPGIMHRLDKEVSGLVVIARTADSYDSLKKQFQDRTVKKEYTALVYGRIEKEEDIIKFPIDRASTGHKMAALPETAKGKINKKGKRAITEFKILKKFINYTLVQVKIKTGRTHQIRVHMTAYGHPIVGDNLYSTKKTRELNKKLELGRIFLFAHKLSFSDLKDKIQTFKITMPIKLKKFLEKIK